MPFHDYATVPWPEDPKMYPQGRLTEWLVSENEYVQAGTPLATVSVSGRRRSTLTITFPARIEKLLVAAGAEITPATTVLKWLADGENLPYGRAPLITETLT
jgi:pyruvate/2-oxoglutarate dehydrogenase complex dihydrolipoamide acyltransferase (E2) component